MGRRAQRLREGAIDADIADGHVGTLGTVLCVRALRATCNTYIYI